jgi:transcriptional regulator with XRE-family HTH domain
MVVTQGVPVTADALRGYIKTLRQHREMSQDKLAKAMGWSRRAYIDWETGATRDIKAPQLVRGLLVLNGSFEQVAAFTDAATFEDGEHQARKWLLEEPRIQAAVRELETGDASRRAEAARTLQAVARLIRQGQPIGSLLPPDSLPPDAP